MDGTSRILLVIVAATLPAALIHELGRAVAALLLTRGRVIVLLGSGRPLMSVRIGRRLLLAPTARMLLDGECLHEPTTLGGVKAERVVPTNAVEGRRMSER